MRTSLTTEMRGWDFEQLFETPERSQRSE